MDLRLEQIGKRFRRRWIVRGVDLDLAAGSATVIRGANGSGKSTILRIISGYLTPTEGQRSIDGEVQDVMSADHQRFSYVAPYVDLYRGMSLSEAIEFHFSFKAKGKMDIHEMIADLGLPLQGDLKDFSSGMLQRVKLALAFCSDDPFLLLDEPLMNLDEAGADWYAHHLKAQKGHRTIVVASNEQMGEFAVCDRSFRIVDKALVQD